jgi:hypothetical protein
MQTSKMNWFSYDILLELVMFCFLSALPYWKDSNQVADAQFYNMNPFSASSIQLQQILEVVCFNKLYRDEHADPLLRDCTTAVARQGSVNVNRETVFSVRSMPRCYKHDKQGGVSQWS